MGDHRRVFLGNRGLRRRRAAAPSYLLKGDYQEMRSKNSIRFLIHGEAEHLARSGDPRAAERALAQKLANRLGVTAVFISVAEQDDLIDQLNDGHGDVIVGSLAITAARSKRIAFSRPIRFVDQLVVVQRPIPRFKDWRTWRARR